MTKSTKELESTVKRLMELNVKVTHDGRPYRAPADYLNSDAVKRQIRSLAASSLGKRLR